MRIISLFGTMVVGFVGGLALVSCAPDGHPGDYPALARKMLDKSFPADGVIRVQRYGRFDLKPSTIFCTFRPGVGLDPGVTVNAFKAFGQSDHWEGSSRANASFGERTSGDCGDKGKGNPIFVRGEKTPNRAGKPYKLTLAIWQGSAVWVATVERLDGTRPDATVSTVVRNDSPVIFRGTQEAVKRRELQEESFRLDGHDISKYFFKSVMNQ